MPATRAVLGPLLLAWTAPGMIAHADAPTAAAPATRPQTTVVMTPARASLKLGVDKVVDVRIDLAGPDAAHFIPLRALATVGKIDPPCRIRRDISPPAIIPRPIGFPRSPSWLSSSAPAPPACAARPGSRSRVRRCSHFTQAAAPR